MSVSIGNITSGSVNMSSTTYSFSHTNNNNANLLVVFVGIFSYSPSSGDLTSISYGDYNMNSVINLYGNWNANPRVHIYKLINPPLGANNCVLNFNQTISIGGAFFAIVSFIDSDINSGGIGNIATTKTGSDAFGTTTNINTTKNNSILVDVFSMANGGGFGISAGSGQTVIINNSPSSAIGGISYKQVTSIGNYSMSWSSWISGYCGHVVAEILGMQKSTGTRRGLIMMM
jgi:hypothetical protein